MGAYTPALFVHILGALGLFAATGINDLVLARLRRAPTVAQVRELLERAGVAARRESGAAVALLGAGLYLTATSWGWRVAWIDVSPAMLLLVVVVGARAAAAAPAGPIPTALAASLADPTHASTYHR